MGGKRLSCEHDPKCCAECRAERLRERRRVYCEANRDRVRASDRARYEANKDREREKDRAWYEANKDQVRERCRARDAANSAQVRDYRRRRKMRFPAHKTADSMCAEQHNACAICRCAFTKTPHADHCHASGWVRGLLCNMCNSGLGYFRDDVRLLARAIRYLNDANTRIEQYELTCTREEDAAE